VADLPAPAEGIVPTHFLVSDDVDRSRAFYTEVLGGEALMDGEPTIVRWPHGCGRLGAARSRSFLSSLLTWASESSPVGMRPGPVHGRSTLR